MAAIRLVFTPSEEFVVKKLRSNLILQENARGQFYFYKSSFSNRKEKRVVFITRSVVIGLLNKGFVIYKRDNGMQIGPSYLLPKALKKQRELKAQYGITAQDDIDEIKVNSEVSEHETLTFEEYVNKYGMEAVNIDRDYSHTKSQAIPKKARGRPKEKENLDTKKPLDLKSDEKHKTAKEMNLEDTIKLAGVDLKQTTIDALKELAKLQRAAARTMRKLGS